MLDAIFFLQEIRLGVEECRRRSHGGEPGDGELVVQTTQRVNDESRVGDSGTAVIEHVGDALEAAAVLPNGHVTLEQAVELLLVVDGALETIVKEVPSDGSPRTVRRGAGLEDIVPDVLGHREVEPQNDACIDLQIPCKSEESWRESLLLHYCQVKVLIYMSQSSLSTSH